MTKVGELNISEHSDQIKELKQKILIEAKCKTSIGKSMIAETLAMLIIQQRVLYQKIILGEVSGDVIKTFPAYSVRIRQCLLNLGLVDIPKEDEEDIQPL